MRRTQVKICGITRIQDGRDAVALGADAIGLNFYPPSPRAVDLDQARAIAASIPPFTKLVGLFVNAKPEKVRMVLDTVRLDLLQFHGDESPPECEQYRVPYIKAVAMRPGIDAATVAASFGSASGLLLDAWHRELRGGSGVSFDWSLVPGRLPLPIILAGGLNASNVAEAIRQVRPFAVDVSGGVEAGKGVKDKAKMSAFIAEVNRA